MFENQDRTTAKPDLQKLEAKLQVALYSCKNDFASVVQIFFYAVPLEKSVTAVKMVSDTSDSTCDMATKHHEDTVLEAQQTKLKPPPMYKVMLLNDDYTPMDFVIIVLQNFFFKSREQATQIMLKVHREGMGVCGMYPRDVAATKVEQVLGFARHHQHPLQCVMEET